MSRPRACFIALFYGVHDDEKTVDLAAQLDISQEAAVGHLTALWLELMSQRGSSSLDGVSNRALAKWARWGGDPDQLAAALRDCRWIKVDKKDRALASGWDDSNGRALRELQRKRAYYKRKRGESLDGELTEKGVPLDANGRQFSVYPTLPNPTKPNRKKKTPPDKPGSTGFEQVEEAFKAEYRKRYGIDPTIKGPERGCLGRALNAWTDGVESFVSRLIPAYLRDNDPWLVGQAHSVRHLPGRLDRYRTALARPEIKTDLPEAALRMVELEAERAAKRGS